MRALLLIASLVGSLAILTAIGVGTSPPPDYYDTVHAAFSPDQQHAYWYNRESENLWLIDLESSDPGEPLSIDLDYLEWAHDGQTIVAIAVDSQLGRYRFATIDLRSRKVTLGPTASHFAQTAEPGKLWLFGRGDYMDDTGQMDIRSAKVDEEFTISTGGSRTISLDDPLPADGYFRSAKVSPDGSMLAFSMPSHREADRFVVLKLDDWNELISAEHDAKFAFFLSSETRPRLLAVEGIAARLELHLYDLNHRTHLASAREESGWTEAARLSPDGKTLALSVVTHADDPRLDLISTDDLSVQKQISVPAARDLLDLVFTADGKVNAISESGALWQLDPASGKASELERLFPIRRDTRWIPVWIGLALYALLWIPLIRMRKCGTGGPEQGTSPPLYEPAKLWLIGVAAGEVLFLLLNFSIAISQGGVFLVAAHLVIAGTAILFLVSAALLRLRANFLTGTGITAMISLGAWFGASIVFAAIASV